MGLPTRRPFLRLVVLTGLMLVLAWGVSLLRSADAASVLFVTDEVQHIDGDESILDRLEFLGHTVEVVDHLDAMDTDAVAEGAELIVISASVTSGNVFDHFSEAPIPIFNWEENLWDDLYISDRGNGSGSQDTIEDLEFNQLDIVQVQIAAKYLTGQAATWGEGDWDGAPGGSVGAPPTGNGLFDQLDIVEALSAGKYLTGPYGALSGSASPDSGA